MKKLWILLWLTILTSAISFVFHATGHELGAFVAFFAWFLVLLILVMLSCDE